MREERKQWREELLTIIVWLLHMKGVEGWDWFNQDLGWGPTSWEERNPQRQALLLPSCSYSCPQHRLPLPPPLPWDHPHDEGKETRFFQPRSPDTGAPPWWPGREAASGNKAGRLSDASPPTGASVPGTQRLRSHYGLSHIPHRRRYQQKIHILIERKCTYPSFPKPWKVPAILLDKHNFYLSGFSHKESETVASVLLWKKWDFVCLNNFFSM